MSEEKIDEDAVLCVSNSYQKKYYLNPEYELLPTAVKQELQVACVIFTEEVGGILTLYFEDDGTLTIATSAREYDPAYDEIGAGLKVKALQAEKRELFESLQTYYKVTVLGEPLPADDGD